MKVNVELRDSISPGYSIEEDYINKASPFLEAVFRLSNDPNGLSPVAIPAGSEIWVVRDGEREPTPIKKTSSGNLLFFKDQGKTYNMTTNFDEKTCAEGGTQLTNLSIEIDFSNALEFDFEPGQYYLFVDLYRASDSEYPLEGAPVTTIRIEATMSQSMIYGYRLNVFPEQLNVNLADGRDSVEFTAEYKNVADGDSSTCVEYTLYYKDPVTGEYEQCPDDWMQLAMAMQQGDPLLASGNGIGQSIVEFDLWAYSDGEYSGDVSVTTSGNTTRYGKVTLTIHDGVITDIKLSDQDLTAECETILRMIKENNGVPSSFNSLSIRQDAVVTAIDEILAREEVRTNATERGYGISDLKLQIANTALPEGNYKLVGRLQVYQVTVAEDFFVFNVNRSERLESIQASNDTLLGRTAAG